MILQFGFGTGRLTKKQIETRVAIARRHGATFIVSTGNNGNCVCGRGCRLDACPEKRYWFVANHGCETRVMNEVEADEGVR